MKPGEHIIKKISSKKPESMALSIRFVGLILPYLKHIAGVSLIMLVLIGIFLGWRYYRASLEEMAQALEYHAMAAYHEASTTEDKAKELYTKALELYNHLRIQYPGTRSAERALFYSANSQYLLGNYDDAINLFSQYLEQYPQGELFADSAIGLGYAYEQKQDYQSALKTYQQFQDKVNLAFAKADILLALARCQEALGKRQEAIATYEKIVSDDLSLAKRSAEERLRVLKAK